MTSDVRVTYPEQNGKHDIIIPSEENRSGNNIKRKKERDLNQFGLLLQTRF